MSVQRRWVGGRRKCRYVGEESGKSATRQDVIITRPALHQNSSANRSSDICRHVVRKRERREDYKGIGRVRWMGNFIRRSSGASGHVRESQRTKRARWRVRSLGSCADNALHLLQQTSLPAKACSAAVSKFCTVEVAVDGLSRWCAVFGRRGQRLVGLHRDVVDVNESVVRR